MKKILALLLAITISLGSFIPALANDFLSEQDYKLKPTKELSQKNENDIYVVIENGAIIRAKERSNTKPILAKATQEEGVYQLEDETYIYDTGTEVYQQVERLEVNLYDQRTLEEDLSKIKIRDEVKNDIMQKSNLAIENGNTNARAVIIGEPINKERVQYVTNYTYKNAKMQDQVIFYSNINTGFQTIESGLNAISTSKKVENLILSIGGIGSKTLSIIGAGITAYDLYEDITGSKPINGNYDDYVQLKVYYDDHKKFTYCDIGSGWQFGAETEKTKLLSSTLIQYYFNYYGGREVETEKTYNITYETKNYASPKEVAYQWIGSGKIELIEAKVEGVRITF